MNLLPPWWYFIPSGRRKSYGERLADARRAERLRKERATKRELRRENRAERPRRQAEAAENAVAWRLVDERKAGE